MDLVTNEDYLPYLLSLIGKAKKSIDVMAFSFAIGSAAGKQNTTQAPFQIARALIDRKSKLGDKLTVRLYIEGIRETEARNRVTASFLEEYGVEVVFGSTHAKGVCVDGRYMLLGSTNFTNQSLMKNYEANIAVDDRKASNQFLRYFNHMMEGGGHGELALEEPLVADGAFKDLIISMIERAKKTVHFSIYFFNHREIEAALVDAASRGVKIVGFVHQHATFALSYIHANRATVRRLKAAGVDDIFLSRFKAFYHSKYIVVDSKDVALGTGNWLVEDVKIHPQLYLHVKSLTIGRALIRHLKKEIEEESAELKH